MYGAIEMDRGTTEGVIVMSVGVFLLLTAVDECVIILLRFKMRLSANVKPEFDIAHCELSQFYFITVDSNIRYE
jgi:hypothetical protein